MFVLFASEGGGETTSSSTAAKAIKIVIILAAVATGAFFAFRPSADKQQSDDPTLASTYICWEDKYTFKLTPAEWDEMLKRGDTKAIKVGSSPGEGHSRGGDTANAGDTGGIRALKCPKCHKFTCVEATQCPNGTFVPAFLPDGSIGQCP